MNLNELKLNLSQLQSGIRKLLIKTKYEEFGQVEVDYDTLNPDEVFQVKECMKIIDALDSIDMTLQYLSRPVVDEGVLHRNSDGRFESDFQTYTCGCGIEFLDTQDEDNIQWRWSSVEHDDNDYYIVGYSDIELEGLRVRYR